MSGSAAQVEVRPEIFGLGGIGVVKFMYTLDIVECPYKTAYGNIRAPYECISGCFGRVCRVFRMPVAHFVAIVDKKLRTSNPGVRCAESGRNILGANGRSTTLK